MVLCFYVYFGYPLLLEVLGIIRRRDVNKKDTIPFISVIIAAYNEESTITEKLENTLSLDYPKLAIPGSKSSVRS